MVFELRDVNAGDGDDDDDDDDEGSVGKLFEFDGVEIETRGNYSKCPRCLKEIKSTFILRHIKLHDQPVEKFPCPGESPSLHY
jgi:hypothetical protein